MAHVFSSVAAIAVSSISRHLGARLLQWLVQYRHQPLLPVLRRHADDSSLSSCVALSFRVRVGLSSLPAAS